MSTQQTKIENDSRFDYKRFSNRVQVDNASDLNFENVYDKNKVADFDLPKSATIEHEYDENGNKTGVKWQANPNDLKGSNSFFNPYFAVRMKTVGGENYPMSDEETQNFPQLFKDEVTAIDLINNPRGASIYAPEDFLYLKEYGQVKLNRLITLRRFAHPCYDDIFTNIEDATPDIARVLGFMTSEKNKLSDFASMSYNLKWKQLNSESEKAEMQGASDGDQSGISGIAGKVMRFVDPKYGNEAMRGSNIDVDPQQDSNRVYGPVDSIASTHIRDVGVEFEQSMTLTFEFEMKSHSGINGKSAFMDLLSNLILMGTNDAKFWGGARYWVGARPSKYMSILKKYDATNWQDWTKKASEGLKTTFGNLSQPNNAKEMLKNIANNAMNMALGKLLNKLGRTGVPVMNSLLSGNPVGLWHLTVGNPMNPIFVCGDLILEKATINFGDELGFDDFPTKIEFVVNLKHAKPKGRAEIENMFNCGKGRIYVKPKQLNKMNNKTSSKSNPKTVSDVTTQSVGGKFGNFKASDIEKNSREVWSFLDNK